MSTLIKLTKAKKLYFLALFWVVSANASEIDNVDWITSLQRQAKAKGVNLRLKDGATSLDLSGDKIGDKGAKTIGDGLTVDTTLKALDLRDNEISDNGAKAIAQMLSTNATLTLLQCREMV